MGGRSGNYAVTGEGSQTAPPPALGAQSAPHHRPSGHKHRACPLPVGAAVLLPPRRHLDFCG